MNRELLLISESLKLNTHLCVLPNFPEMSLEPIGSTATNLLSKAKSHNSLCRKLRFLCCWFPKGGFIILPWEEAKLNDWCHTEKQDKLYDF